MLKYKWYLILGIICIITSNLFFMFMPDIAGDSVDDIIKYAKEETTKTNSSVILRLALISGGLYILLAILKGFFLFLTRQTVIKMSRLIEFDLKNDGRINIKTAIIKIAVII